jgi:saccharopine dehydrogenase (NAD+, L-lysine-forming)
VAALVAAGIRVSVEASSVRAIAIDGYRAAGAEIVAENAWPQAPADAIIFGLKELPEDGTPLRTATSCSAMPSRASPRGRCC